MSGIETIIDKMAEVSRLEGCATQLAAQYREAFNFLDKRLRDMISQSGAVPSPEPEEEPATIPMKPKGD